MYFAAVSLVMLKKKTPHHWGLNMNFTENCLINWSSKTHITRNDVDVKPKKTTNILKTEESDQEVTKYSLYYLFSGYNNCLQKQTDVLCR